MAKSVVTQERVFEVAYGLTERGEEPSTRFKQRSCTSPEITGQLSSLIFIAS